MEATKAADGGVAVDAPLTPPVMTESVWRHWLRTENLGLGLTLGYLFLTALGMLHRALVFVSFRINVFDYAEPSDFLLAALRDPLIILVCLAPIPAVAVYFRMSYAFQRRSTKTNWLYGGEARRALAQRYRRPLYLLTAGLWALAASLHYANSVSQDLRAGKGRRVQVDLIASPSTSPADTTPQLLLGTTQKYLFLYDATKQVTSVIPVSNISRLRIDRRKTAGAPVPGPAQPAKR
ncbi:MAG: hypothetical protein ABI625_18875 [bacterium]